MTTKTIYAIPAPFLPACIRVVCLVDMGSYEWSITRTDNVVLKYTNDCYGNAEVALSDALNWCRRHEIDSTDFDEISY